MEPYTNNTGNDETPSQSSKRLLGKVAVITGGARGIGAATAKLFAENGAHVVIADVLDDLGATVAESIGGRYIHCDVSKEEEVESAIEEAVRWKGRVDVMVNNAGVLGPEGSITRLDMEEVNKVMSVNLMGTLHGIKHAARAMVEGGRGGSIICTSSSAAMMGGLGSHEYTMSKAAVVGVVRSAACELGAKGIRVNCVLPHGVATEMLVVGYRRFWKADMTAEEVREVVGQRGSLLKGRGGTEEDVAHACVFLASDESGFVTAHNLVVDGGYTSAVSSLHFIYY
ncbi:hypothetical protein K1719_007901 [Acacia pycnantha]|nr:hypothetical protein K1719_007901 [Acacia pycnantha]